MNDGLTKIFSMLGDMPKDSKLGASISNLVSAAVLDAKAGGTVGTALRDFVDAGRNPNDSFYAKMEPEQAMAIQQTLNGLKGHL